MNIAVVILNWNGRHFLEKFLPSVVLHSGSAQVVVADNYSTDDSIPFLQKNYPQVKIILNGSNLGFAGGYNAALKNLDADYFILLNSDVEVTQGWIGPIIQLMEQDKSIAICQPKLLSYDIRDEFEYAGAAGGFIDMYGYPFCRGRIFQALEKDTHQYDDTVKVFWATGACMFVRASAFRQAGGFDDLFFAHMEEIDLCWRMQLAGFSVYYCSASTVYHLGGGTLNKINPHKTYLNFRNNLMMLYKNLDTSTFTGIYLFRLLFDFIAALKFLVSSGGIKEMMAVVNAHIHFHQLKGKLKKTAAPAEAKKFFSKNLVYQKSILLGYYVSGKKLFSQLKFK